ncbi:MAG: Stk1 family PASTA domain-containing Ser/Thr kinase [Propionibacteriaceae bacterium]|jgi:serine/threonine-protein kinase|nr:Stk1 family PASTA domain-containing Ser/Thr kinase [Propionibacteriaceae bacterium]
MSDVSDPLVGAVLDGRYEIKELISSGGMASVYLGRDRRLGRTVAIKVMKQDLSDDVDYLTAFDREARAASSLQDPHIVSVFDQGQERGRPFIVMEYVEGGNLRRVMARNAPMEPMRALRFMEAVALGLATAHDAGIIHRDIKPENVLISTKGQVKVADFGLAKAEGQDGTTTLNPQVLMGSVKYIAPERVTRGTVDKRADIYSSGVMFFEMLTGKKPYEGEDSEVVWRHVKSAIPAPSTLRDDGSIPPWLDQLVLSLTSRNPANRPADGREMLRRIRTAERALDAGIGDDPSLSAQMNPAGFVVHPQPLSIEDPHPWRSAPGEHEGDESWSRGGTDGDERQVVPQEPTPMLVVGKPPDPSRVPKRAAASSRIPAFNNESKYRRRRVIVAIVAVLVLALTLGVFGWWFTSGRYTDMPDLTNQNRTDALRLAEPDQLNVTFEDQYSEDVPLGLVITTDPLPAAKVRKGAEVKAYLSIGPERFTVPKLIGLTLDAARAELANVNLELGLVTDEWSEDQPIGIIISAAVAAGEPVKRGTPIGVSVSKGPKPIEVKDYTGQSLELATQELRAAGLEIDVTSEFSDAAAPGTIIAQDPKTGELHKGDIVKLIVSKGPELVPVPSGLLFGRVNDAIAALEAIGLVPEVGGIQLTGIVIDMRPASGALVAQGSTVHLTVA